jgi:4-hydroxybutyryl-CoA dehydratase / vinylacetyl-CoA-Delta-isomerase
MTLKTSHQYLESLRALKLEAKVMGETISGLPDHPMIAPSTRAVAVTYDCAQQQETKELFRVNSSICGQEVNRFTHVHSSPEELIKKVKMLRHCGGVTGCCFQRCAGMDAANAVFNTTFDLDREKGTSYHERFKAYHARIQSEDLVHAGCMTDPKGDRSKRPTEQSDPDLFLRVVERRSDGVVVRGAKLHQTGMVNSHETIVMPTQAMRQGEEDYAICFAVPTNTRGIHFIYGRQTSDTRKLEDFPLDVGNLNFGGQEVMTVFDNVFVPEERIFLNGEVEFCGRLVERFAAYHRQSYGGCKVGVGDVLIGATALIAHMNGLMNASHIKDKLVEMIHLNETLFACGLSSAVMGVPTAAGGYEAHRLMANVCKLNVTRFPYEISRLATDIAGGLLGTMPAAQALEDPLSGSFIRKYLVAAGDCDPVDRMKVLRLIENLVAGAGSVAYLIESVHGAGPPQAQRVMIARQGDLESKMTRVRSLLKIEKK